MQIRTKTWSPCVIASVALTLASAGGCGGELASDGLGSLSSGIVNGSLDPGHPAVGLLHIQGEPGCTATLIGSRTVLTAAHCVTDSYAAPYVVFNPIGFSVTPGGQVHSAASVVVHPNYGSNFEDIAVVRLQQPVGGVTPMSIAQSAPHVGEAVTLVGFGITSDNDQGSFGVKRQAPNSIGQMTPTEIVFYGAAGSVGNICNGDSGGPAFATRGGKEVLVGVHSYGVDACGVEEHDQRVDVHYAWVEQQAQGDLGQGAAQDRAPQVSITSPAAEAVLGPAFQVSVDASDDLGVASVDLFVDGALHASMTVSPYLFQVEGLLTGRHDLRAEAVDTSGQRVSTTTSITVRETSLPDPDPSAPDQPPASGLEPGSGQPGGTVISMSGACSVAVAGPPASGLLHLLALSLLITVLCRRRKRRVGSR